MPPAIFYLHNSDANAASRNSPRSQPHVTAAVHACSLRLQQMPRSRTVHLQRLPHAQQSWPCLDSTRTAINLTDCHSGNPHAPQYRLQALNRNTHTCPAQRTTSHVAVKALP
jgi:hypothetical protein